MLKSKHEHIQMTIEDFFSPIRTKPTYLDGIIQVYEKNELLKLLEEMKEETFSVKYENEFVRFVLPICIGEIFHYMSGSYETEFSVATGKNDISRTSSICFAGGGKMLRKISVEGDKLTFISDTVDWDSKITIPHSARNWSRLYFSDKGERKRSAVTLSCETHEILNRTLPKRRKKMESDNAVDYLNGQVATIEINYLDDEIIQKLNTIPFEIKEIQTKGDTLKIHSNRDCFLELKRYNGLMFYPGCIAVDIKSEGSGRTPIIHIK